MRSSTIVTASVLLIVLRDFVPLRYLFFRLFDSFPDRRQVVCTVETLEFQKFCQNSQINSNCLFNSSMVLLLSLLSTRYRDYHNACFLLPASHSLCFELWETMIRSSLVGIVYSVALMKTMSLKRAAVIVIYFHYALFLSILQCCNCTLLK